MVRPSPGSSTGTAAAEEGDPVRFWARIRSGSRRSRFVAVPVNSGPPR
jgi:hypothetical protein